jgi:hypothetical protein
MDLCENLAATVNGNMKTKGSMGQEVVHSHADEEVALPTASEPYA